MDKLVHWRRVACLGAFVVVLAGCATKPTYQNTANNSRNIVVNAQGVPNYHLVQRGDTVSQIAQRYGMNYRQIGALNRLDSQYTIYTGQWLKLWEGAQTATQSPVYTNTAPSQVPVTTTTNTSTVTTAPTTNTTPYTVTANSTSGYQYPTTNQVIRNFDSNAGTIGMWFAGQEGDPVLASHAGTVLYSGNGLPEYGNLIMIRHSDNYVTAYAHNSQLHVQEGDQVQQGQRIASMGSTGTTNQVALEFQVRENGNPIDPRAVLGR